MRPIPSGLDDSVIVGEDALDYRPVPALPVQGEGELFTTMLVRWTLTDDERRRVAAGEDISVAFPHAVAPHALRLWGDNGLDTPPPFGPDPKGL